MTTHAGSLPRPDDLLEWNHRRQSGGEIEEAAFQQRLSKAIMELVAREKEVGIDIVGDGEFGKSMSQRVDYGAWRTYSLQRLSGIAADSSHDAMSIRKSTPGNPVLTRMSDRRDRTAFADFYADQASGVSMSSRTGTRGVCVGPVTYTGQAAIARDVANFKSALAASGIEDGFMTAIGPASCSRMANEYYQTDEELLYACAEAMREEYCAIVDGGLVLQIDDPAIAESYDQIDPEPSVDDYIAFTMIRIEALNYALRDIPEEKVRFHLCFGSWHGPHSTDIEMKYIVEPMLRIKAGAYSFEAANVRHEHEWKVWQDVKLPDGKLILPGVVSHATTILEHPELVAERICRFAQLVGRENVIASTDCGLGGRIHPQLAWAKLEALTAGAALASDQLW